MNRIGVFLLASLMTVGTAPAFANNSQPATYDSHAATYVLSGVAAKALNVAFRKELADGATANRLAGATIRVSERPTSVTVRFEWPNAAPRQLTVDGRTQSVHSIPKAQAASHEVTLPGLEARAIAAVIQALISASARLPLRVPRADFDAGNFQIQEHVAFPSPTDKPGYYVAYIPVEHLPCPSYTIYRVDPVTFAVYEQPRIC